jgi:hypothetical protein
MEKRLCTFEINSLGMFLFMAHTAYTAGSVTHMAALKYSLAYTETLKKLKISHITVCGTLKRQLVGCCVIIFCILFETTL